MPTLEEILVCPSCNKELEKKSQSFECEPCSLSFKSDGDGFVKFLARELYAESEENFVDEMEDFWGKGWENRANEDGHKHLSLSSEELKKYFDEDFKRDEIHQFNEKYPYFSSGLFYSEVDFNELEGKTILNIGCGCGTEAAKLSYWGKGNCIPLDITSYAAKSTQKVLRKLDCNSELALQADARFLPLKSNSIDVVYTSGVLHHSANIQRSFEEIHRVLKPGGKAYIGLYGKTSMQFLTIMLKGILKGKFSKESLSKFVNLNTEQAWQTDGGGENPRTDLFTKDECIKLAKDFSDVRVRNNGLLYLHLPKIGTTLEKLRPSFIPPGLPVGGNNYITAVK